MKMHTDYYISNKDNLDSHSPEIVNLDTQIMAQFDQLCPPPLPILTRNVNEARKQHFEKSCFHYWVCKRYLERIRIIKKITTMVNTIKHPVITQWLKAIITQVKLLNQNDLQYCNDSCLGTALENNLIVDTFVLRSPVIPNTLNTWTF
jgi:hypothetical protein